MLELEDGRCLPESNAILWYLAEGTPFLPARTTRTRWLRAQVLQWMFFEQYSHEPYIATVALWITHHVEMTPEREAALPGSARAGRRGAGGDGAAPARAPFFVGERYTIADIALYAYTHVAAEGGFDLAPFPAVRAWIERVAAQPGHIAITA